MDISKDSNYNSLKTITSFDDLKKICDKIKNDYYVKLDKTYNKEMCKYVVNYEWHKFKFNCKHIRTYGDLPSDHKDRQRRIFTSGWLIYLSNMRDNFSERSYYIEHFANEFDDQLLINVIRIGIGHCTDQYNFFDTFVLWCYEELLFRMNQVKMNSYWETFIEINELFSKSALKDVISIKDEIKSIVDNYSTDCPEKLKQSVLFS